MYCRGSAGPPRAAHCPPDRHVEDRARALGPDEDPVAYQRDLRRDRIHRAALTNVVLRHYDEEWRGSIYVLRDRTGRTELVPHLGALWPAAAKLVGCPLQT